MQALLSALLPAQLSLQPLYGGGFWPAFAQLCLFYYACGVLLHCVVPRLLPVQGIQHQPRKPWEVQRDALYSLGGSFGDGCGGVVLLCRCCPHRRSFLGRAALSACGGLRRPLRMW